MRNKTSAKIFSFGLVGIAVTVVSITLQFVCLEILDLPIIPVYIVLWLSMVGLSYYLNLNHTFNQTHSIGRLIQYYRAYLLGLIVGLIYIYSLKYFSVDLSNFLIALSSLIPRTIINFIFSNRAMKLSS